MQFTPESRFRALPAIATALALCLLTGPALAASGSNSSDITTIMNLDDGLEETPGFDTEPTSEEETDWSFRLGVIAGFKPEYEGSDNYDSVLGPNWRVAWRNTVILQGKILRVQYKGDNYLVGALVGREPGRDGDDILDGLDDVDSGWSAGLFGRYEITEQIRLLAAGRHEFAGGHGGLVFDAGAELKLPFNSPLLKAYAGVTYASSDYMEEFFSISNEQSTGSGKWTYDADAGIKNLTLSLSAGYDITDNWVIGATVRYDRLVGDAEDSPIVDEGGSRDQFTGGVTLAYQF